MKNPTPKEPPDKFKPFIYPITTKLKLERTFKNRNKEFLDIVSSRRSSSNFSKLAIDEVAELLYLATRIQSIQVDNSGFILTKRTSPSAGARHPIDLLISLNNDISRRTLLYYNPIEHSLGELLIAKGYLQEFFNEIDQNLCLENSCLIWFAVQTTKTSSKYDNSDSLYWRDTGALLYCIQLIATYLGYKTCPVGTLAGSSFGNLFRTSNILSGGGILMGK